ncbi:VWA domain-containing protein [Parahaliea sp. F7430]|uniref:VWA domain-containing protein n=1 Tax=Sediminihaliea albiluteola TaxID=2758564 RepID=A0A7W2TVT1_9GAMM|nr:VWA domain-containing protein [Sediminihaliea albiluteola]MBA6412890.1 VWA domain-containing protein [Sediminihaliea albiluteola]
MARPPSRRASSTEISRFLGTSKAISAVNQRRPRLLFAIDATASRQPTWDTACHIQQQMFQAVNREVTLSVQLCYYRGLHEFYASPWLYDSNALAQQMARVYCEGGHTQIARLLRHILSEHQRNSLRAAVFIGDAIEEQSETLCQLAGQCGLRKVPLFLFQEGHNPQVQQIFQRMAKLSGGAWARFDAASADVLAELLKAVAGFVTGGRRALKNNPSEGAKLLLQQLKP